MKNLTVGQRVAKSANKQQTEFKVGNIIEINDNKILVSFDNGYSRWCNVNNLEIVTK